VDYIVRYFWDTGSYRRGGGGRGLHRPVSLGHWVFETRSGGRGIHHPVSLDQGVFETR